MLKFYRRTSTVTPVLIIILYWKCKKGCHLDRNQLWKWKYSWKNNFTWMVHRQESFQVDPVLDNVDIESCQSFIRHIIFFMSYKSYEIFETRFLFYLRSLYVKFIYIEPHIERLRLALKKREFKLKLRLKCWPNFFWYIMFNSISAF